MDDIAHQAELDRLRREIDTLPVEKQAPLLELYEETVQRHADIRRASEQSQESLRVLSARLQQIGDSFVQLDTALQDLRLVAKMALFDLEVRRREQAEQQGPPADDAEGDDD